MFRIVPAGVAVDSPAWVSDGNTYRTREDADRAGRSAVAAKLLRET
jgi:hypothetical protein